MKRKKNGENFYLLQIIQFENIMNATRATCLLNNINKLKYYCFFSFSIYLKYIFIYTNETNEIITKKHVEKKCFFIIVLNVFVMPTCQEANYFYDKTIGLISET